MPRKFFPLPLLFSRKKIPVDEIFVHENYTTTGDKVNDIALLRLGNLIFRLIFGSTRFNISRHLTTFDDQEKESTSPPSLLLVFPQRVTASTRDLVTSMVGFFRVKIFIGRFSGWGAIGQHSADTLQEAQVVS